MIFAQIIKAMGASGQSNKLSKYFFNLLLSLISGLISFSQLPTETNFKNRPGSIGISGDTADIKTKPQAGLLLAGGGGDVDAAMQWLLDRSGGGDIVIIRASGGTGYNEYLYKMAKVNSVETLLINSRELAENDTVAQMVRNAEALFIAGGDQWNYTRYWMGTQLNDAINYLINKKKAPVGGTSAGLAILGEYFFDAKFGSIVSDSALLNPMQEKMSINQGFIKTKTLRNIITDSHYNERKRQGRHIAMMAFIKKEHGKNVIGIGIDEKTAMAIDDQNRIKVFGTNNVWLISANSNPEINEGKPLDWNRPNGAIKAKIIAGSFEGTDGGKFRYRKGPKNARETLFNVENGRLLELVGLKPV
jgi:cyanophycinase